jgi:hypothetical protein
MLAIQSCRSWIPVTKKIDPKEQELRVLFDLLGLLRLPDVVPLAPTNWSRVLELAVDNGVVAQLHEALTRIDGLPAGPAEIMGDLQARCRRKALRGLAVRAELLRLLSAFASAGLEVIPLKGPILADRHYRIPAFREFGDLDLLVHPVDRDAARYLLEQSGYHSPYENKDLDKRYQIAFIHRETGELVELHWRIAGPQYQPYFRGDFLWDHSQYSEYKGVRVRFLAPEAEALYLAIHAYKHDWSRIQWIWDIHELLRATPEFDWNKFSQLGLALQARRVVRATLQLAEAMFGDVSSLAPTRDFMRPVLNARQLSLVARRMGDGDPDASSAAEFLWLRVGMADTSIQRLRLLWTRMQPTDRDRELLALPRSLQSLYVFVRPFRIVAKLLGFKGKAE